MLDQIAYRLLVHWWIVARCTRVKELKQTEGWSEDTSPFHYLLKVVGYSFVVLAILASLLDSFFLFCLRSFLARISTFSCLTSRFCHTVSFFLLIMYYSSCINIKAWNVIRIPYIVSDKLLSMNLLDGLWIFSSEIPGAFRPLKHSYTIYHWFIWLRMFTSGLHETNIWYMGSTELVSTFINFPIIPFWILIGRVQMFHGQNIIK